LKDNPHVLPWHEKAVFRALSKYLRVGDVFIDAGANIGIYTVLASKLVGPSGRVICIEMIPDTIKELENHIYLNELQNVTIIKNALSDTSGKTVTASVEIGKYGKATISEVAEVHKEVTQIQVSTTTLDRITIDIPFIRLMKMDLEGVELQALTGGQELLKRLEYLIYERRRDSKVESNPVDTYLINFGFRLDMLDNNNWLARREKHNA